jgi:putative PEP-CTERM system TPR-repeat lipoprotein
VVIALSGCLVLSACVRDDVTDPIQAIAEADSLVLQGDQAKAIQLLLAAASTYPEHTGLRWQLGQFYLQLGAAAHAQSHLLKALDLGSSPSSVLPLVAQARLISGEFDALFEQELPAGLSAQARAAILAIQARARASKGEFDEAELLLQEAARGAPDSEPVRVATAYLLLAQHRRQQAEAELRSLVTDYPSSAEGLGMLADLLRDTGDLPGAERTYSRALEHGAVKVHLLFLRAQVRLDLGDRAGAEEDTAALESTVPGSFAALHLRARLLLLEGDYEAALVAFEEANKLMPSDVATLLYGGVAAYAARRSVLAEDWLLRALKELPNNGQARLVLGAMRYRQGRYAEAEHYLRPVQSLMKSNPLPQRLLAATLVAQHKSVEAVPLLSAVVASRPEDPRSQLDLSMVLVLSGDERKAAATLDALVERHPDFRPAYEYLIAFHVRERQWAEAMQWADRFAAHYPEEPQTFFLKGEALLVSGRITDARSAFETAISLDPSHPKANLRLASMALDSGDADAASVYYDRILAGHPDHLDALQAKAQVAIDGHRLDDAVALLEQAIRLHPAVLSPRIRLARIELSRGKPQHAVDALDAGAVPAFLGDVSYLVLLAESHLAADSPQLAADAARELVALQPDSRDAYGLYARILAVLDDKVALEETLKQMLTIDPEHVPTRLELARLQIATERYEVAERLLGPVLADLDRPPLADFLFGLILTATDRATQAVAPLKHAYRTLPSERTLLALANAEAQSGRVEDAIARTAAWLDAHPDDVEVRVTRAGHLVQAERVTEAIAEYERALALAPNHAVALNNLAWYALAQDPQRAMDYAKRALEVKPDSVEVAHTLVSAQVESGEWRDAELTLDRVLPLHPTDTELLWLSARVLHQKGRAEEALRRLERILNAEPPDVERERARALLVQIEDEIRAEEAKKLW